MQITQYLIGALLIAVLGGCSGVQVNSDYDPAVNFTPYRTFDWMPGPQVRTGDPRVDDATVDSRIRTAVERRLTAKGYHKESAAKPDFYVLYHAALKNKMSTTVVNNRYGYPYYTGYPGPWVRGGETTTTHPYEEGTLILDVIDAGTKQLVWRGSAQARLDMQAREETKRERVREAVREILEQFPPK